MRIKLAVVALVAALSAACYPAGPNGACNTQTEDRIAHWHEDGELTIVCFDNGDGYPTIGYIDDRPAYPTVGPSS